VDKVILELLFIAFGCGSVYAQMLATTNSLGELKLEIKEMKETLNSTQIDLL